jgi:hypothetical protein
MALPSHLCFTLYSFHKQTEIYKLAAIRHHARSLFLQLVQRRVRVCCFYEWRGRGGTQPPKRRSSIMATAMVT